jgi:hypothetical protein
MINFILIFKKIKINKNKILQKKYKYLKKIIAISKEFLCKLKVFKSFRKSYYKKLKIIKIKRFE